MLDRTRMVIERRLGTDSVDPNTHFEEGALLQFGATGWARSAGGSLDVIRGIAGINAIQTMTYVSIKEQVSFAVGSTASLKKANIQGAPPPGPTSVRVTDLTGTTLYTEGPITPGPYDYTIDYTHGTITKASGSTIGTTALVSYTYQRTMEEAEEEVGLPISNNLDETFGSGNTVVFQGNCLIFTTMYDTSKAYSVNAPLYDNGDGNLTSNNPGTLVRVGAVKSVPTASDPFLGAELSL